MTPTYARWPDHQDVPVLAYKLRGGKLAFPVKLRPSPADCAPIRSGHVGSFSEGSSLVALPVCWAMVVLGQP
jgi:hypothetical protein